jgi:hypothetical protein
MIRFFNSIVFLVFVLPANAQSLAPLASVAQSQNPISAQTSSETIPLNSIPQNVPCVDQPKSHRDLATSFNQGAFPLASRLTGTWVEIGYVDKERASEKSLNCSGIKRGRKFEFVLVADGYLVTLHAIGMTYPQKVTMRPDSKGSVEFPVDFSADEGPETYQCRVTKRGTLACLVDKYGGVEFKKMKVGAGQIYEVTEVN